MTRQHPTSHPAHRIGRIEKGSIRPVLDRIIPWLDEPMPEMEGRGIVTVAGGPFLRDLWIQVQMVRRHSNIPIWAFHLGPKEVNWTMPAVLALGLQGVTFVDALPLMRERNYQIHDGNKGWMAKSIAILHNPFRFVCFLDADCAPLVPVEEVFEHDDFRHGFLAFHDIQACRKDNSLFSAFALKRDPNFREWEAGSQLWDKQRHWKELQLFSWINGRPQPFHQIVYGDKDLAPLSFLKLKTSFTSGEPKWMGYGIRHCLTDGTEAFDHRTEPKRKQVGIPQYAIEYGREFDNLWNQQKTHQVTT